MSDDEKSDPDAAEQPRPRPQYGEYASPEEQRARMRRPDSAAHPAQRSQPVAPAFGAAGPVGAPTPYHAPRSSTPAPAPAPATLPPARLGDRVVTAVLLGYGLINVILAIPQYVDLPAMMSTMMTLLKIPGTFTNVEEAHTWGIVAAVVLAVGYVLTAVLALLRLRTRRLTWWVPVVGAAITYVIVSACIAVPMVSDPAFVAFFSGTGS